jgi:hypothetical protein
MAKLLKQSRKFRSQSSRLGIVEKASFAKVKISRVKTSSASMGGGGASRALARGAYLFDSSSSYAEDVPLEPRRKPSQKSPWPEAIPKPFDAPIVKGTSV